MPGLASSAGKAVHATPPHTRYGTRAGLQAEYSHAALGLLTPPPSVSSYGRVRRSIPVSPSWSIKTESDDIDYLPPHQPSLSASSSAASTPLTAFSPPLPGGRMSSDPFNEVPLEITQAIGSFIDSDQHLSNFIKSCRSVNNAIEGDRHSFWRRRFLSKFEKPLDHAAKKWSKNNLEYKKQYQRRRYLLRVGANFKQGRTAREVECLKVLRDLINDSFHEQAKLAAKYPDVIYEDKNIVALTRFCGNENVLHCLFKPTNATKRRAVGSASGPEPLLQALTVLLSPLLLTDVGRDQFSFPTSQLSAYSPAIKQPAFQGCAGNTINMEWALHQFNFWKYHFTREAEADITMFTEISELGPSELPQLWNSQLSQDSIPQIGKNWKTVSAFLRHDAWRRYRTRKDYDDFEDEFSGTDNGGIIQDLTFHMTDDIGLSEGSAATFKKSLDINLPPKRAKTRSGEIDDMPVTGDKTFRMEDVGGQRHPRGQWVGKGWLEPRPKQRSLPGWQRMTMMKYFENNDGSVDWTSLWAYEGVMLPGGRIVVGRWWSPDAHASTAAQYCGPFIMWNTN